MIEINLGLIATGIALVGSIWKFANSISQFGHSVKELEKTMSESVKDRKDLRNKINEHSVILTRVETQYKDIREDLTEIKRKVS